MAVCHCHQVVLQGAVDLVLQLLHGGLALPRRVPAQARQRAWNPISLRGHCCTLTGDGCHLKAVGVLGCMLMFNPNKCIRTRVLYTLPVDLFSRMLQIVCVSCLTMLHHQQAAELLSH